MPDIDKAKEKLTEEGVTCAAVKGDKTLTAYERGIAPLLEWYDSVHDMTGYSVADKVVGKAPAMLYVLMNVKEVFAPVMTYAAEEILKRAEITCGCDILTEKILRRDGRDICPMEKAVLDIDYPEEALKALKEKVAEINR